MPTVNDLMQAEHGDDETMDDAVVHGPFFSWLNPTDAARRECDRRKSTLVNDDPNGGFNKAARNLISDAEGRKQLLHAVRAVLVVVETQGPFDGIYGFSEVRVATRVQ